MADSVRADPVAAVRAVKAHKPSAGRHHNHRHGFSGALKHAVATSPSAAQAIRAGPAQAAVVPGPARQALRAAMERENAPDSWIDSLTFIMAKESGGQVGARNPTHSARGLYQLTAANYALNPRGAASFGDPVEEAQGGIRYIRARYGTADAAAAFWRKKGWF